jgi:hypothetical protein
LNKWNGIKMNDNGNGNRKDANCKDAKNTKCAIALSKTPSNRWENYLVNSDRKRRQIALPAGWMKKNAHKK